MKLSYWPLLTALSLLSTAALAKSEPAAIAPAEAAQAAVDAIADATESPANATDQAATSGSDDSAAEGAVSAETTAAIMVAAAAENTSGDGSAGTELKSAGTDARTSDTDAAVAEVAVENEEVDTGLPPHLRSGWEIYQSFYDGLAEPACNTEASNERWERHFASASRRMSNPDSNVLPLFGYVVDQLRANGLPTEYALIPFVESEYRPNANSRSGPAGMWQFITTTARNHRIQIGQGYDGRLSPVESTNAAISYLNKLHEMFGGDWRLAAMGYNVGEYRVLQSMRQAGITVADAHPMELPNIPQITRNYVEKLHALTCVIENASKRPEWRAMLDRPVPRLVAQTLPADGPDYTRWVRQLGHSTELLTALNPQLNPSRRNRGITLLAPVPDAERVAAIAAQPEPRTVVATTGTEVPRQVAAASASPHRHTVRRGESAWSIARLHGVSLRSLLSLNGLNASATLQPGMTLKLVN
ncbi:MAG: transglycosylase SLT domain-containing protein [Xanthomonadaceae bacterium]|jgi:membrane-bound lytic murein transglycosylase D|nr:transglycosylase SLT domain-containing protein [Xanthomonadaceae bacterium]